MKLSVKEIFQTFILSIGIFLFVLDLFIINVSLPRIQEALHLSNSEVQWIIILYIIGYASLLINAGKAGEVYGRKNLYVLGMVGFTLSSLLCGLSDHIYFLLLGRLVQGISSGLMVPQAISLITLQFDQPEKRTIALGIYGSIAGVASVLGQLLGGILPDQEWIAESWRLIFLINLPIGVLAVSLTYICILKDRTASDQKVDSVSMVQLFALLILLIYPLIVGPELHWPLWIIGMMILALLLLYRFIQKQYRLDQKNEGAMLNFSLFRNKVFNVGLFIVLAYYMVQDSYFIINSNYLQAQKGFSSSSTGIAFVYQGIGYVLASIVVGRLIHKWGRAVILSGILIMILGLAMHLWIFNQTIPDPIHIHFLFFFYGLGCGSVLPSLMTLALRDLSRSLIGVGSALYLTIQQIAICLGIAFIVGLYYHQEGSTKHFMNNIPAAYLYAMLASIGLLCLVIVLVIRQFSIQSRK
ncbi:MFS transporter [Sphingobacterium tabacisoli]|uniref:MFS transporter n=1 Tax=Sphingobacterium tabacisoli TaxID=2044855 RepID=A0ABW5L3G2_9SPHI|nr:MFS transporter [Sphingobacterium tabacisoli]